MDLELNVQVISDIPKTEIPKNIPEDSLSFINALRFYGKIVTLTLMLAATASCFIIILSILPWSYNLEDYLNYFNTTTVTSVVSFAVVSFGPWYITYYTYLIKGRKMSRKYLAHIIFHTIFWPIFYFVLVSHGIYVWFYYLDFLYFAFAFLPISFHTAYENISNRDFKFAIKYATTELFVIISALGYTFFLFPVYMNLTDAWKILWCLILHPIWFEFTMLLPQRLLATREINKDHEYLNFLPAMHSIFHNATIRRTIFFALDNFYFTVLLITVSNIEEIILRLTVPYRDKFFLNLFFKLVYTDKESSIVTYGSIVNMEMLFELVGIMISPAMMLCFMKYGYLFIFNNGSMESIVYNFIIQLIMEILTDVFCIMYEVRIHKINLLDIWHNFIGKSYWPENRKFFLFCIYGICTMGVLGMIYTTTLLPRALFCSEHNILTCTYNPL